MQSELMQLLRILIVMTVFSGIGYFSFLETSPNFFWPILGGIYFLFALIVLSFDATLRMIFVGGALARHSLVWMIAISLGMTLLGLWSQFQLIRSQLKASLRGITYNPVV